MIELLSPAKDLESGKAAIDYGADAVYIGGPAYSARSSAHNSLEDIASLVDYAHLFQVRVYVALNTLLTDTELADAEKLIHELYKLNVDALIIQDMGILKLSLPPIALFASTQTTNTSIQKVLFLQNCGFKRIILERALSLNEIKEIRAKTSVELECFVHGAICVSYSGQCFLSNAIGGRSANRGECAQPCRKSYRLIDSSGNIIKDRYPLLSLKDLNLSRHLGELIDLGINSFKIEGRMKDINYVKNITAYYRQKLDDQIKIKNLQKSSNGIIQFDFTPDPEKTFNRGFTDYFFNDKKADMCAGTSGSLGEYIGIVNKTTKSKFFIDSNKILINGDGCCYLDENGTVHGFFINNVEGSEITPNKPVSLKTGIKIYRTHDQSFLKVLDNSTTSRKIPVKWILKEESAKLFLTITDENSNQIKKELELTDILLQKSDDYESRIREVLEKIGNTSFISSEVTIMLNYKFFIRLSILKKTRNEMIRELLTMRLNTYKFQDYPIETSQQLKKETPYSLEHCSLHILNAKAKLFFEKNGGAIKKGFPFMTTRYCILNEIGKCLKDDEESIHLPLELEDGSNLFNLGFDCKKCEMLILKSEKA